jgi:8-oxo-dGTP pyrophosphatase MutT (NUDIX family)
VTDHFEARLRAALARSLPGLDAQIQMAPMPRVGWDPLVVPEGLRDAGALVLLYPVDEEWHFPLTVRADTLTSHTSQVSLPGGRVDEGESIEQTALREACEEIGIAASTVRIIGRLTPLHIPVSNHMLYPVVGVADRRPDMRPAEQEVARILEVPVSTLIDPARVKHDTLSRNINGATIAIDVPYFAIDDQQVWGATGMVLSELRAIIEAL